MARTRAIITHIATFLAGVFVSTLLATYQLSSNELKDDAGGGPLSNSLKVEANAVRGGAKPTNRGNDNQNAGTGNDVTVEKYSERKMGAEAFNANEQLKKPIAMISDSASEIDESVQTTKQSANKHDNICSLLPPPTPTALSMWSSHLPNIFNATKHPGDQDDFTYHDFTALLLHFMTPDRIQRGVKTLPLDWSPVERGLDVIYKRWEFIQNEVEAYRVKNNLDWGKSIPPNVLQDIQNNPKIPRKLNIVVMGGSVTMGVVCNVNPVTSTGITRRSCAWPGRMTSFFSALFGGYELVEFHTVAMGGTNTESGITMWDYSLLPGDTPYPDVVINAYATNDMHYNSVQSALAKNITLEDSVMQLNQAFIRQLLTPKRECGHPPPLLLYLDDYLGNEQNEVLTTMISSQVIHLLSVYYGLGSMSYADAVRDVVYGDTKEWWFQPNWYENGAYQRAVHPHMGMHIANVWVVAFYFLNLASTYCSLPELEGSRNTGGESIQQRRHNRLHAGLDTNSKGVWDYAYQPHRGMPYLRANIELKGGPQQKPRGMPPILTDDLSLENITQLWSDDANTNSHLWKSVDECLKDGKVTQEDEPIEKPCMYSWVVGLERFLDKPKALTGKLKPHVTFNKGWSASDDNNKLGWVPSGVGSKFTMEWERVTQPIRAFTLMIMRSYGEKWEGSKLKVEIWSKEKLMAHQEIVGFHDKKTSETYNIKIKIGTISPGDHDTATVDREITIGSNLKIVFELVEGKTFKISGMAICDH
eukprot:CCRYP_000332-RA/>CCRYP_000332-RA protein AED:0.27 eAED:0.27 QI:273/1/1/1/1/1/2/314/757